MRTTILILVWLAAPALALAQPSTREAQQRAHHTRILLEPTPAPARTWMMFGQLSAGYQRMGDDAGPVLGGLDLGVSLAYHHDACQRFAVGGHLRAGAGALSAEQWLSACVAGENAPILAASHLLQWQVVPALSAPLVMPAGPFTRETLGLDLALANFTLPRSRLEMGRWMARASVSPLPEGGFGHALVQAEAALFRVIAEPSARIPEAWSITGPAFTLHTGADLEDEPAPRKILILGGRILTLQGFPFGALRLDAQAEVQHASLSAPETDAAARQLTTGTGSVRLWTRLDHALALADGRLRLAHVSVAYDRRLWPTLDRDLVLEDRAALVSTLHVPVGLLSLQAFAAHATLRTLEEDHEHWLGGAEITLDRAIGFGLWATASVEAARSFYARLDEQSLPLPAWGVRVFAAVATRWGGARTPAPGPPATRPGPPAPRVPAPESPDPDAALPGPPETWQ